MELDRGFNRLLALEKEIKELRMWVEALSRRLGDLEASAFQLVDEEEVLLLTIPRRDS